MSRDPVVALVAAARRRLWWAAVVSRLPAAIWAMALVVLAMGVLTAGFGADFSTAAIAGGALVSGLAALAPGLACRPTATEAALHADRVFGGNALITTALEAGAAPHPSPADEAVLRRARAAATAWREERRRLAQPFVVGRTPLALVPAFLGLWLLQLAPSPGWQARQAETRSGDARPGFGSLAGEDGASEARRLRETLAAAPEYGRPADGTRTPAPAEARGPDVAERVRLDSAPPAPGVAGPGESGAEAGDARGNGDIAAGASAAAVVGTRTGIQRQGPAIATGAGEAWAESAAPPSAGTDAPGAAAPPASGGRTMLSAAQRAHARRYLDTTGTEDD